MSQKDCTVMAFQNNDIVNSYSLSLPSLPPSLPPPPFLSHLLKGSNLSHIAYSSTVQLPNCLLRIQIVRLTRPLQLSHKVLSQWSTHNNIKLTIVQQHLKIIIKNNNKRLSHYCTIFKAIEICKKNKGEREGVVNVLYNSLTQSQNDQPDCP